MEIRFVELFAGVGGFRFGLEKTDTVVGGGQKQSFSNNQRRMRNNSIKSNERQTTFRCVWANEWDRYAASVYRRNYGKEILHEGDIRKVSTDSIPDCDLLTAGFPCPSWSIAGKRGGLNDERGELFWEILRIVEAKKPKMVLLENVKGLLTHDEGKSFEFMMEKLCRLGYGIDFKVLNSKFFGVPQNRERVFIVALRKDLLPTKQCNLQGML